MADRWLKWNGQSGKGKDMKRNMTELVMILDKSGSMHGMERDTIGGFNSTIEAQRAQEGEVFVTTVLFSSGVSVLHDRISISRIRPMTEKEYTTGGMTALLDAVGSTIDRVRTFRKRQRDEDKAEKVIFVITTDGLENASREYSRKLVKEMIEHEQEANGWEFLFLGANMDAETEAGSLGIRQDRSATYTNDKEGVSATFASVNSAVMAMRMAPAAGSVGGEWKKDIEQDQKRRRSQE